jgi:hypothetical protein
MGMQRSVPGGWISSGPLCLKSGDDLVRATLLHHLIRWCSVRTDDHGPSMRLLVGGGWVGDAEGREGLAMSSAGRRDGFGTRLPGPRILPQAFVAAAGTGSGAIGSKRGSGLGSSGSLGAASGGALGSGDSTAASGAESLAASSAGSPFAEVSTRPLGVGAAMAADRLLADRGAASSTSTAASLPLCLHETLSWSRRSSGNCATTS